MLPASAFKHPALTALVYLVLGLAGLALAIPPGYASPVFPAAGFAVAIMLWSGRRAWPGIALGSLLLNLISGDLGQAARATTVITALGIAIGSTLQAYVAALLAERAAGRSWQRMDSQRDIVRVLFAAGPLACLVSASTGVGTLYVNGLTSASEALFTWWNWWAGDTLGVLVALPLSLTWLLRSQFPWRWRPVALGMPMLVALGLIAAGYWTVSQWERTEHDMEVRNHAERLAKRLEQRFIAHQEALAALKRLIEVTPDMSYAQFDHFTRITLRENPDIFALSFNPYVRLEERAGVEQRMARSTQKPDFEIKERDAQRRLIRAGEREDYVVVGYISPLEGNRPAIGYDINSEPVRQDAIRQARESRRPSVTAPLQLVQENQKRVGALVLHPAYASIAGRDVAEAGDRLTGFAVGVIKLDQMAEIATRDLRIPGLAFRITDLAAGQSGRVFQSDLDAMPSRQASVLKIPLVMADRMWELAVYPTAAYHPAHRPWIAWATGAVGILLAVLLQVLLLITTGHAAANEDKVKSQDAELKDRATLINTLFEISPDGFVVVGSDDTIRLTNPAFHTMTGIAADEVIGRAIGHLDNCLSEVATQPQRFTPLAALFAEGSTGAVHQTLELTRPREAVLQIVGVRRDAGSIDRFICFRDVTRETEVDRMKSEFLSHAAHELRTPMASIYGFTELLMTQDFDEAERREFLDTIYRQSELMISIINELLDLVRIEARRGKDFTLAQINVRDLLHDIVADFKPPQGRPAPKEPLIEGPLRVSADRKKLIQAVSNVISNAYKYSPGGGTVDIELAPPTSGDPLFGIRITDHGIGMTPEQLAHVCERFYRADTSGKIPGTGLGMSIVKEIVELHGGRLELASKVGAGTTVTLWLPAADMQANRGQPCSPHPAAAHQESPS
jgi:signal transduction histidine kinase